MPWHTLSSWKSVVFTHRFSSQLEAIRKEFKPPRSVVKTEPRIDQDDDIEATPSNTAYPDGRPGYSSSGNQQEDFRVICEFFAFAPPHTGDDDEVWASLAAHATCQTEPSWPEFYTKHMAEIDQKIAQLYQERHPAVSELDVSTGPNTGFLHPEFESGLDQEPVMAFEAIR